MATLTVPQAVALARQCIEAGRLPDAENVLRQILAREPQHADALHLLGIVAHQSGRQDVAVDLIRSAIVLDPISAHYRNTMGIVRHARGELDEAVAEYRCVLQIDPGLVQARNNLANALKAQGRHQEAVEEYRAALRKHPDYLEARNNLANALRELGDTAGAVAEYRAVLAVAPDSAMVRNNLGAALGDLGQGEAAVAEFRAALALSPTFPQAQFNLGNTLRELGQYAAAGEAFRGLIAANQDFLEAHLALSLTLRAGGELDAAIAAAETAVRLRPDLAVTHNSLGNALQEAHRPADAIAAFQTAIARQPDFADAHNNLGNALKDQGDLAGALASYRQGLALRPDDAAMHSNLVYSLLYAPETTAADLRSEEARWTARHASALTADFRPHDHDRDPARRLRIGYVSPNFWGQAECHFVLPLLEAHDREAVEIFCYADVRQDDEVTQRYRQVADHWCDTLPLSDRNLAERIRTDRIDLLIDLTMHLRHHRLLAFARRPAPVQLCWLAYPGRTGLPTIDCRITDAHMDPPASGDTGAAEHPLRLPDAWCCYEPVGGAPEVAPLPALARGHVTFGSLNNPCKMNQPVLRRWAATLGAVPDSRLLLLCPEGPARDRIVATLAGLGVPAGRVDFVAQQSRQEYLRLYDRIDIALDPFPYNGITTTCDALWMGVPVLTVPGSLPHARAGWSLLSSAGLAADWAASSDEEQARLAARWAGDLPGLAALRAGLREHMRASPLMDARRFASALETEYRSLWRQWCAGAGE